jgi:hypothetical protein
VDEAILAAKSRNQAVAGIRRRINPKRSQDSRTGPLRPERDSELFCSVDLWIAFPLKFKKDAASLRQAQVTCRSFAKTDLLALSIDTEIANRLRTYLAPPLTVAMLAVNQGMLVELFAIY